MSVPRQNTKSSQVLHMERVQRLRGRNGGMTSSAPAGFGDKVHAGGPRPSAGPGHDPAILAKGLSPPGVYFVPTTALARSGAPEVHHLPPEAAPGSAPAPASPRVSAQVDPPAHLYRLDTTGGEARSVPRSTPKGLYGSTVRTAR